jgi:tetratricopeptide (TPR) repeat protein
VRPTALLLALILGAVPAAAQAPPLTHEQALDKITKGDVEARRQAAAWLGERGAMTDASALLKALHDDDQAVRALAEQSLWQVWSRSGDAQIDALFQRGVDLMQHGAADEAIQTFTTIIQRKPDFAEGWNKRATIYYLVGEYEKSLQDCAEVMKLNPGHFGALAGYGQIYLQLDQPERALDYFERALKVNPNLRSVEAAVGELRRLIAEKRKGTI